MAKPSQEASNEEMQNAYANGIDPQSNDGWQQIAEENTVLNWINTGRTLQRFLLQLTNAGIANAYMNQPCEINELSSKIYITIPVSGEYPEILLRIRYAKQVAYSKRKDINGVIIK